MASRAFSTEAVYPRSGKPNLEQMSRFRCTGAAGPALPVHDALHGARRKRSRWLVPGQESRPALDVVRTDPCAIGAERRALIVADENAAVVPRVPGPGL